MIDTVAAGAVLYAISLVEGVRRLPENTVVLRRAASTWQFVRLSAIGQRLHLVSWCLPLSVPLVLPPPEGAWPEPLARLRDTLHARLGRTRRQVMALRLGGLLTLTLLVVGVPLAVERSGVFGLVASIALVETVALLQGVVLWGALRRIGRLRRQVLVDAMLVLNPFSTQRGAELVYARATEGVPRDVVMWELLGERDYVAGQRSEIYDVLRTRMPRVRYEHLTTLTGATRLDALLRTPADGFDGAGFCPRCGAEYSAPAAVCADCDVALVPSSRG